MFSKCGDGNMRNLVLITLVFVHWITGYSQDVQKSRKEVLHTQSVPGELSPTADAIEISVASNGNFTMGKTNGPILLYGHPNPWSSGTTIKLDGTDIWNFSRSYPTWGDALQPPAWNGRVNTSIWRVQNKIRFTQTLTIVQGSTTGNYDTGEIRYTVTNIDATAHSVGVRVMLDTMLGTNDGAPFRVPGVGPVTTEREWSAASIPPYYQAFDDLASPTIQSQGTLIGGNARKPDRFVAVGWAHINGTPWDFTTDPGAPYYDDSAVGIYWFPVLIQPGQTVEFVTYYGLGGIEIDIQPPLVVGLSAPKGLVFLNGTATGNPFSLSVYLSNSSPGVTQTAVGITTTLNLPSGLALPAGETATHNIPNMPIGAEQYTSYSVQALSSAAGKKTYSLTVTATNITTKTVQKDIYLFGISTTPPENATVDPTARTVTAQFNVSMNPATVNNSSFQLFDESGNPLAATVTYNSTERKATLTLSNNLQPNKHYKARLSSSMQSADGVSLPNDVEWKFTTTSFTTPLEISFRPNPDGFQFGNSEGINYSVSPPDFSNAVMWPRSWWQQFDYSSAQYPFAWRYLARPSDFPDWELFAEAFGEDQVYYVTQPIRVYKPLAVLKWMGTKRDWGGSCYGFSLASLLFYDGYISVPGGSTVFSLPINDLTRRIVNKHWVYGMGAQYLNYKSKVWNYDPNRTVEEIKRSFLSNRLHNQPLAIWVTKQDGKVVGHSVVPYRIVPGKEPATGHDVDSIFVYDNNYPNLATLFIKVNRTKNEWEYARYGWSGNRGLIPDLDVAAFSNSRPILALFKEESLPASDQLQAVLIDSAAIEIYFSDSTQVLAKNPRGQQISSDDIFGSQIPGAFPIIPLTGIQSNVIGFYLPKQGNERMTMDYKPSSSSLRYLTVLSRAVAMNIGFQSPDFNLSHKYSVDIENGRMSVRAGSKSTRFGLTMIAVSPFSQNVIRVMNSTLAAQDSLDFQLIGGEGTFSIKNYGSAKQYDLALERASSKPDSFTFVGLNLGTKQAHLLSVQNWDSLSSTQITVSIDDGMDGSVDKVIRLSTPKTGGKLDDRSIYVYPNPFNPNSEAATIRYSLSKDGIISIKIYDIANNLVRTLVEGKPQLAGVEYSEAWNGRNDKGDIVGNGVYLYIIESSSGEKAVGRVAVLR